MSLNKSILVTIKKLLGIDQAHEAFDLDIITHINSAFMVLAQLGVGPEEGFFISDDIANWDTFLATTNGVYPHAVQTYIYLKVKLTFDPPQTAHLIAAVERQIEQLEWRLNTNEEREVNTTNER